jgi:hypothetical protein
MGVLIMKKNKILNLIKLGMLAIMLILLFFISERFVNYLVTIDIETLTKAVYVILATVVIGIYTMEEKEKTIKEVKEPKKEKVNLFVETKEKDNKKEKEKKTMFDFNK